ncbi:MAG TPA: hypothetical protein VMG80_03180 [Solirubrobacteraceae bacterium]|nr:hypothetical protein [Solirubrobacteraceae bacterium]
MALPFSISIAALSLLQGSVVAVPRAWDAGRLQRLRSRRWALVPPVSVVGFVLVASFAERASADGLTYLALVAVPPLGALALGWLAWDATPPKPWRALLVTPVLFGLAWADHGGLAGQAAACCLSALSCAALGALLAAVTPPGWLAAGIVAMALADTALVVSDLLQKPNSALNAAHPAAGLPQLQYAAFGSAAMGYGDLFVAGVLGALLATAFGRAWQLRGAAFAALLACCFDLLFFFVSELPATVPIAVTLLLVAAVSRRSRSRPEARPGARRRSRPARSRVSAG